MSAQTIIVADDTDTFRAMLTERLKEKGFTVIEACDGLEALKAVNEAIPDLDLLVLDLLMPKMLGFDVLKRLRDDAKTRELPVFVITGLFKTIDDVKKLKALGANGFVDKSQSLDEIALRIEALLSPDGAQENASFIKFNPADRFQVGFSYDDKEGAGYAHTLTPSAIYMAMKSPPPEGTKVKLNFRLPKAEGYGPKISAGGEVIKAVAADDKKELLLYPEGMEVEFKDISQKEKKAIDEFIKNKVNGEEEDKAE